MRRQPVAHPSADARRLNRRALITLGGATAGVIGVTAGLRAVERAGAAEPPSGRQEAGGSDGGGLTPHREAYYRRARF